MLENDDNLVSSSLVQNTVELLFEERAFEDSPLTEKILSEKLGETRSRIRDTLKLLEAEELVTRRRKKGVFVTKPTPRVIAELYDLRVVLESFAARLAVQNATDNDLVELRSFAQKFDEAAARRDNETMESYNTSFHETLINLSGSEMLTRLMVRMNFIRKSFMYAYKLEPESQKVGSPFTHIGIVDALTERDVEKVERVVKNHILIGKERVLEQALGFKMTVANIGN